MSTGKSSPIPYQRDARAVQGSGTAVAKDGWLPARFGAVNKRYGTPHWLLTLMFIIGVAPILLNLDMTNIANAASALQQINAVIILIASMRLRQHFPQLHASSAFKIELRNALGAPHCWHWRFLLPIRLVDLRPQHDRRRFRGELGGPRSRLVRGTLPPHRGWFPQRGATEQQAQNAPGDPENSPTTDPRS